MPRYPQEDVVCISCKERVTVEMMPYGGGRIAVCPNCKRLAYNGD